MSFPDNLRVKIANKRLQAEDNLSAPNSTVIMDNSRIAVRFDVPSNIPDLASSDFFHFVKLFGIKILEFH